MGDQDIQGIAIQEETTTNQIQVEQAVRRILPKMTEICNNAALSTRGAESLEKASIEICNIKRAIGKPARESADHIDKDQNDACARQEERRADSMNSRVCESKIRY